MALQSLNFENQPEHNRAEAGGHGQQQYEKRSEYGDDEEKETHELEGDPQQNFGAPKQKALDGMETDKTILFIRFEG
jgi:hypothetical protein